MGMHAWAIGIENACDLDAQFVLPPVVEEQSFRATLAFVVTRARTDRIDVPPVTLGLRMHIWVAVNFRRRGLQDFCLHPLGKPQHVDGAMHAGFGRLHWIVLIVDGRSWTGKIVDLID